MAASARGGHNQADRIAESQAQNMALIGDALDWMQEHRVRVNVVSGLLVGSGIYIQLEYPAVLITYSFICTLCYCVVKWSLSDACGLACSLSVLVFLAHSTFENWPDWQGGDKKPITIIYLTGVLIMLGVKGYELSH